ncbi:MAG: class I SAM-dependent methyltransferase [bacterium]
MHASEYAVMRACEDAHWWYVGLHDITLETMKKLTPAGAPGRWLDAGCGTGGLIEKSAGVMPEIIGMEPSEHAFTELKSRQAQNLVRGDLLRSPFPANAFDIVTSHDVIGLFAGHDLSQAVNQLCRMVRPGGHLILNLPAFQFLHSDHDRFVGNQTRFNARIARTLLENENMQVVSITCRLFFLFPLVAASRLLDQFKKRSEVTQSDVKMPNAMINTVLLGILRLENRLIRLGICFPWGLSLFVVAQKRN